MNKEILQKKLLYRSCYRGCKETDYLIGNYAKENIEKIVDLNLYEAFLNENDGNIYDWIMNKIATPEQYLQIIKDIQTFHKIELAKD